MAVNVCQIILLTKIAKTSKNQQKHMTSSSIRIVTRESPLALWQANFVRDALVDLHPQIQVEVLGITTEADRLLDISLESLGGKGAFVKELEQALLTGRADIAVHSMKDVTINLPVDLSVPVVLKREDPRDVFVSNRYACFADLPLGARVGTSSLRRRCQLMARRPDLRIQDIRGNVGTRLRKLDEGQFDALILAAAGLKRLGLESRVSEYFSIQNLIPAISQGALGLEINTNNTAILALIEPLADETTQWCVTAERALNRRLGGDCHVPIAGHAEIKDSQLTLNGLVGRLDGSEILQSSCSGLVGDADSVGDKLGTQLLAMGAGTILREVQGNDVP
ncbi:MAG: hydroxymethylbilane synthase [Gammaproteobacteria bacterium]|jgi:hydroxymethylbilane synthase